MEPLNMAQDINPLQIFPKEIWEIILEQLENTEVILSVFQTFPQLEDLSKGKEFSWLIDQLLPYIFPKYLNFRLEIKACRLVSKRWKTAIDNCFEIHPERLPYNSLKLSKVKEHDFSYFPLANITTNIRKFLDSGYTVEGSSESHNPFPGRSFIIKLYIPNGRMRSETTLENISFVLKKFGKHLHHIHFDIWCHEKCEQEEFIRVWINNILQWLTYTPNLRSCKFESFGLEKIVKENNPSLISCAVNLPQLEILDMFQLSEISADVHAHILSSLVTHEQIKKLGIHAAYWDKSYGSMFPNLTELHLVTTNTKYAIDQIRQALSELPAPQLLRKFRLGGFNGLGIYELLPVLTPLQIESVELLGNFLNMNEDDVEEEIIVSSVKHLSLRVYPYMNYEFLECLPSLTSLSVYYTGEDWDGWEPSEEDYDDSDESDKEEESYGIHLRNFLLEYEKQPGKLNVVWESLPSLTVITVVGDQWRQYFREYPNRVYKSMAWTRSNIFHIC